MTMDEQRWPGPSWDFTIHEGGFPAHPVDGDLYRNYSGLMYICVRGKYIQLSIAEWNELLGFKPEQLEYDEDKFLVDGKFQILAVGDKLISKYGTVYFCRRSYPVGYLVLESWDTAKNRSIIIKPTRLS